VVETLADRLHELIDAQLPLGWVGLG